jgi:ATP-dependent Clp protease ATP-binding subunit ClpC
MFERFTEQARRTVVLAQEEARLLKHDHVGTEHLLLGLLQAGKGAGARALASANVTLEAAWREAETLIGRGLQEQSRHIPFTEQAKQSLELSLREALDSGDGYIGTGHILLGLIRQGDGRAVEMLGRMGADLDHLREQAVSEVRRYPEDRDGLDDTDLNVPPEDYLGYLQAEVTRLRAVLREHGINPYGPENVVPPS